VKGRREAHSGMLPVMVLTARLRLVSLASPDIPAGMLPLSPLLSRSSDSSSRMFTTYLHRKSMALTMWVR